MESYCCPECRGRNVEPVGDGDFYLNNEENCVTHQVECFDCGIEFVNSYPLGSQQVVDSGAPIKQAS